MWVATGSGDLISLDPCANRMTIHELPDSATADPFALAPDYDVVGYTASGNNKIGMMVPKGSSYCIQPSAAVCVTKTTICNFPQQTTASTCNSGYVCPIGKTVEGQYTKKDDGTLIEARINTGFDDNGKASDSFNPLGITPVKSKAQGTFFFTVGNNGSVAPQLIDRVGFARFPVREKIKYPRDDDDENDGKDGDHHWHDWHGHSQQHDVDDDGVDDVHDYRDKRERDSRENDSDDDDKNLSAGASKDYTMVTLPSSLALVALTTASDPLAQIGIDIYDSLGLLVARSLPTPGVAAVEVLLPAAGTYTCRIKNYGSTAVTYSPNLLIRELWDQY